MAATPARELKDFVDSLVEEWDAVPGMDTRPVQVIARIMRMSYYIEQKVARNLAAFGLTRGEFEVMAVLTRNSRQDITPKILQSKILISSGGLSNRIKSLEAKKLLTREQSLVDGRGVILRATPAGRELTLKAAAAHMRVERDLMQGLSEEDGRALAGLLRKLILLQGEALNRDGYK